MVSKCKEQPEASTQDDSSVICVDRQLCVGAGGTHC